MPDVTPVNASAADMGLAKMRNRRPKDMTFKARQWSRQSAQTAGSSSSSNSSSSVLGGPPRQPRRSEPLPVLSRHSPSLGALRPHSSAAPCSDDALSASLSARALLKPRQGFVSVSPASSVSPAGDTPVGGSGGGGGGGGGSAGMKPVPELRSVSPLRFAGAKAQLQRPQPLPRRPIPRNASSTASDGKAAASSPAWCASTSAGPAKPLGASPLQTVRRLPADPVAAQQRASTVVARHLNGFVSADTAVTALMTHIDSFRAQTPALSTPQGLPQSSLPTVPETPHGRPSSAGSAASAASVASSKSQFHGALESTVATLIAGQHVERLHPSELVRGMPLPDTELPERFFLHKSLPVLATDDPHKDATTTWDPATRTWKTWGLAARGEGGVAPWCAYTHRGYGIGS